MLYWLLSLCISANWLVQQLTPSILSCSHKHFAQCTVQFPDPHWKLRNRKKRIVQPQLVEAVAQLIAPGGQVFLQSDVQEVHLWTLSIAIYLLQLFTAVYMTAPMCVRVCVCMCVLLTIAVSGNWELKLNYTGPNSESQSGSLLLMHQCNVTIMMSCEVHVNSCT